MFSLFEQNHFGRLDPLTFGVWCNIDAVTGHPRVKEFAPLMLAAFHSPPGKGHHQFIDELESDNDRGLAFAAFSLFAHESRHFFDLLTTPYGVYLSRRSLVLQFCFIFNLSELTAAPALYFPFSEWARDANLLGFIDSDLTVCPEFATIFAGIADSFHKDHALLRFGKKTETIRPCAVQILEGLAILSQESSIRRYLGESAVETFRKWTRSTPSGDWYYGAIDFVLQQCPEIEFDALSLLLYLSLFGSPASTSLEDASPAEQLNRLVNLVKGLFSPPGPVPPSFAHFEMVREIAYASFQEVGQKSPVQAFREEYETANEVVQKLSQTFSQSFSSPGLAANLTRIDPQMQELFSYCKQLLNLGATICNQVVFKRTSNLRMTHYNEVIYELPRALPYFESPYGFFAWGILRDALTVLVGFNLKHEGISTVDLPGNRLVADLKANVPAGMDASFVIIATAQADSRPAYAESALKLFQTLYYCRMASDGFPKLEPIAESYLGSVLAGGQKMYAAGKRVAFFS